MLYTLNNGISGNHLHHLLLLVLLLLAGCSFNIKNLAKGDIDMVVDQHILELNALTDQLLIKLYKRNPKQLAKNPGMTIDDRLQQLSLRPPTYRFEELDKQIGDQALEQAFSPTFSGDRVFSLMVGLKSMLYASYGMRTELFLLDDLDQQLLYYSARNLEILDWRLNNNRKNNDQLYLLSNGYQGTIVNLSFERIFGKMILIQDMMAKIVSGKSNRAINTLLHGMASTVFFPIPL
ncbi:MAG: hypothetical protein ACJAWL_001967 [Motiliproteus sp.]|jgi:hypothetical protein